MKSLEKFCWRCSSLSTAVTSCDLLDPLSYLKWIIQQLVIFMIRLGLYSWNFLNYVTSHITSPILRIKGATISPIFGMKFRGIIPWNLTKKLSKVYWLKQVFKLRLILSLRFSCFIFQETFPCYKNDNWFLNVNKMEFNPSSTEKPQRSSN